MILDDGSLIRAIAEGELAIEPLVAHAIQPNSIDLHLGTTLRRPRDEHGVVSRGLPRRLSEVTQDLMPLETYGYGETMVLRPGEFALGVTAEYLKLSAGLMARGEGCSSVARAGLMIIMAGVVDAGFEGTLTLELVNLAPFPLVLQVGERIGQLVVARLLRRAERPYGSPGLGSRYRGQVAATAAIPRLPQWTPKP